MRWSQIATALPYHRSQEARYLAFGFRPEISFTSPERRDHDVGLRVCGEDLPEIGSPA